MEKQSGFCFVYSLYQVLNVHRTQTTVLHGRSKTQQSEPLEENKQWCGGVEQRGHETPQPLQFGVH